MYPSHEYNYMLWVGESFFFSIGMSASPMRLAGHSVSSRFICLVDLPPRHQIIHTSYCQSDIKSQDVPIYLLRILFRAHSIHEYHRLLSCRMFFRSRIFPFQLKCWHIIHSRQTYINETRILYRIEVAKDVRMS